ncbi:MAG TPA: PadR family transcriptional regulator [Propionibacteriaceae bacterium]|nr:PadR family transcriptional regulator [Propionibacteriaceae bacterium]
MPPIGVAVLALLAERAMHPYEMLQTLRERHEDVALPVSIGSLYHAVQRLSEKGYVRPTKAEHVGNRPERTTYEILDRGREVMRSRLYELLASPTPLSQVDHAGIGELHNLEPSEAVAALDARIATLDGQIAEHERLLADAHARNVDEIYLLYGSYATAQQHHEREWMATLRDRIETGALTWPSPT